MNHAMYTIQTRRGYSSTCFLIESWRIKEKLAMEENIPKTDSLCYSVLIVIGKSSKPRCFNDVKKLPIKYHANSKAWIKTDFLFVPPLFRHTNGGAKQTNYRSTRRVEEKNKEDENEQDMVPSFAKTYEALQKVKAFFYALSVTDADRENILSLENSYFQLRQNSAKKQKTMYAFFVKKVVFRINRFHTFILFLHYLEK
jgi:hypothetical protein